MFGCHQEEGTTMLPPTNFSVETNKFPSSPTSGSNFNNSPMINKAVKANTNARPSLNQDCSGNDLTHSTIDTFTPNSWKTG